jgi:DNA-binding MarR family transcriptional regulator
MTHSNELEIHLGYWLRLVSNHVSHAFALKVEARGVTVAEWVILRALFDRGPTPPSQLAEHLNLTRGAITKLADRLLVKAMITRTASKDDKRYQTLDITDAGKALVPKLTALADQNDMQFFGALTSDDRAHLDRILKTLTQQNNLKSTPIE